MPNYTFYPEPRAGSGVNINAFKILDETLKQPYFSHVTYTGPVRDNVQMSEVAIVTAVFFFFTWKII